MLRARSRCRGFSLIEILVVLTLISLLAGAVAPMMLRDIARQHERQTLSDLRRLVHGMRGDPALGTFGYVADVGRLPNALEDLNQLAGLPAYAWSSTDGVGYGWSGPYVPEIRDQAGQFVDAWNTPYRYLGTAQIESAGRDRTFGTGDDLRYPASAPATQGDLSVTVVGLPSGGGAPEQLDSARASVFVTSALDGVRSENALAGSGPFTATGLHYGAHGVRASGVGSYAGAESRDVVVIRGRQTTHSLTLVQP